MINALLSAAPWLASSAFLLWLYSLRSNNVSHVDILWPLLHVMACLSLSSNAAPLTLRGGLLLLIVTAWGVRLATYLAARAAGRGEDRRYAEIRARYGESFRYTSLGMIFLLQAFLALLISSIFYPIVVSQTPWRFIDTVLLAAATFGLLYEIVADLQLSAFLQRLDNPGQRQTQVLRSGLWKYSRHPNYFGEWFFWLALSLLALSLGSWIGLVTMTLVSWLLLRFTGVARMEQRTPSLRPEYRDYQSQTPAFVPTFINPRHWISAASRPQTQQLLIVGFVTASLLAATPTVAAPVKDLPTFEHWYFAAYIDDKEVGYHQFEVRRDGDSTYLNSRANFEYRLWKVPLFSYAHEVSETYDKNLCLQNITSTTKTRKNNLAVKGQRTAEGFTLEGSEPGSLEESCLTTFAYWTQEILTKDKLLNGQDGSLVAVQFSPLNPDDENTEQRFRLQADAIDLTLTYSNEGLWQGLESALPAGRRLVYKLERYRNQFLQEDLASRTD